MVLLGHLAGGYLATLTLLKLSHTVFTPAQTAVLLVIGTFAGEAPDIDLLWYSWKHLVLKSSENDNHRDYPTHAPLAWLSLCLTIFLVGVIANSVFIEYVAGVILVGSWSHFLLDSIGGSGVMWLWPFLRRRFYLFDVDDPEVPGNKGSFTFYWNKITRVYPKQLTMYIEIIVTVIGLYVFFHFH